MGSVYVPPIGRQRLCAPHPPGWPIALGSTRVRDEPRESAQRSRRAHWPRSMVRDDRLGEPSAHSTTAETPWPRRESRGPGGGERSSGYHRLPADVRPAPPPVASSRAHRSASAITGNGRSAWSSRCVASARARASIFGGVARRPASHVRYDSGDTPSMAANAACDWPNAIRHCTQRAGLHDVTPCHRHRPPCKCGIGAGRTSVSQSVEGRPVTFFACTFAPGAQAEGAIGEFFRKMARPASTIVRFPTSSRDVP